MTHKVCTLCQQELPLEQFAYCRGKLRLQDGSRARASRCKSCVKAVRVATPKNVVPARTGKGKWTDAEAREWLSRYLDGHLTPLEPFTGERQWRLRCELTGAEVRPWFMSLRQGTGCAACSQRLRLPEAEAKRRLALLNNGNTELVSYGGSTLAQSEFRCRVCEGVSWTNLSNVLMHHGGIRCQCSTRFVGAYNVTTLKRSEDLRDRPAYLYLVKRYVDGQALAKVGITTANDPMTRASKANGESVTLLQGPLWLVYMAEQSLLGYFQARGHGAERQARAAGITQGMTEYLLWSEELRTAFEQTAEIMLSPDADLYSRLSRFLLEDSTANLFAA